MSSNAKEVMRKIEHIIQTRTVPKWVGGFLDKLFFQKCLNHSVVKNEQNRYCITCDASICKSCVTGVDHKGHKILTIYRHVYQNVVPLSEMEMHFNCDKIQPYKCNKKWVVSLTPLPHNGSGSLIEGDGACVVCKRKLTDPDSFRYCSVKCKVQVIYGRYCGIRGSNHDDVGTSRKRDARDEEPENPSKRKRSRKGIPVRAPFR